MKVYAEYQRMLGDANAADFGDLLLWPTHAMQVNTEYRAPVGGRFDTVLADEYQDVNRAQYNWLRLLAGHGEIFCVGDDDQSIFRFRGADVSYIRRFAQRLPEPPNGSSLEENFRSDGHILDAANAVIARTASGSARRCSPSKPIGDRIEVVGYPRRRKPRPMASPTRSSGATPKALTSMTSPFCTGATLSPAGSRRH